MVNCPVYSLNPKVPFHRKPKSALLKTRRICYLVSAKSFSVPVEIHLLVPQHARHELLERVEVLGRHQPEVHAEHDEVAETRVHVFQVPALLDLRQVAVVDVRVHAEQPPLDLVHPFGEVRGEPCAFLRMVFAGGDLKRFLGFCGFFN